LPGKISQDSLANLLSAWGFPWQDVYSGRIQVVFGYKEETEVIA
jgi:hypothetical protein